MVNNFANFYINRLFENSSQLKLAYSKRFRDMLENINDDISKRLLDMEDNDKHLSKKTYIDIDDDSLDKISFLICTKVNDIIDLEEYSTRYTNVNKEDYKKIYNSRLRSTMKINKFINEITNKEYTSTEKEGDDKSKSHKLMDFVNKFKSYRKPGDFEVVKGEEIKYWYAKGNNSSDFEYSCMIGEKEQEYLDFYCDNDNVSMLILKDDENSEEEDKGLIVGRALLWKTSNLDGMVLMDRIYTTDNEHNERYMQLFINYAINNNYLYKEFQNTSSEMEIITPINNESSNVIVRVSMDEPSNGKYPYLDTLKFFDTDSGILTNDDGIIRESNTVIKLNKADGTFEYVSDNEEEIQNVIDIISNDLAYYAVNLIPPNLFWKYVDDTAFVENHKNSERVNYMDEFDTQFDDDELVSYLYDEVDDEDLLNTIKELGIVYDDDYEDDMEELLETLSSIDLLKIYGELDLKNQFVTNYIEKLDYDTETILSNWYGGSESNICEERVKAVEDYFNVEGYAREYASTLTSEEIQEYQ